jgi:hypothetical protein
VNTRKMVDKQNMFPRLMGDCNSLSLNGEFSIKEIMQSRGEDTEKVYLSPHPSIHVSSNTDVKPLKNHLEHLQVGVYLSPIF